MVEAREESKEARNLGCRHASCNILIIPLDCVVGRVAPCAPLVCFVCGGEISGTPRCS